MKRDDLAKEAIYTPEELAEKLKLSTATVYKLLNQDKLPYFKVGKSYRIPSQALTAYMMTEGNLKRFIAYAPEIPAAARSFVEHIAEESTKLKRQITAVILFGSYARGIHTEESDIDLLVLLKKTSPEIERQIAAASSKAMASCDFDEFLSPIRMTVDHWHELASMHAPLYEEILKEGIILWPSDLESPKDIENAHAKK
jgi:excisionase family DNA binding protein